MDEDGYLQIVDRKKDMILVSGFNVYPNEVEAVIATHPGVTDAAVVGVPDDECGEIVVAFVTPKDESVSEEAIRQHCKQSLTGYKVPRIVVFKKKCRSPKSAGGAKRSPGRSAEGHLPEELEGSGSRDRDPPRVIRMLRGGAALGSSGLARSTPSDDPAVVANNLPWGRCRVATDTWPVLPPWLDTRRAGAAQRCRSSDRDSDGVRPGVCSKTRMRHAGWCG